MDNQEETHWDDNSSLDHPKMERNLLPSQILKNNVFNEMNMDRKNSNFSYDKSVSKIGSISQIKDDSWKNSDPEEVTKAIKEASQIRKNHISAPIEIVDEEEEEEKKKSPQLDKRIQTIRSTYKTIDNEDFQSEENNHEELHQNGKPLKDLVE